MLSPLLLALGLAVIAPQARELSVPTAVLQAVAADPVSVVIQLVEAGVPAGAEIREVDRQRYSTLGNSRRLPTLREQLATDRRVPISSFLDAFNREHADYRAAVLDGIVVVRPTSGRAPYLDAPAPFGRIGATGLMRFTEKVFAPLDSRLDQPGGRVGSDIGPVGIEIDRGRGRDFDIDPAGRRVIDVLNDLSGPDYAWLVTTDDHGDVVRFGYVYRHGTTSEMPIGRR